MLAAGEGTRMRSATPKVLHRIAGRTLVEHAVRAAAGADARAPRGGGRTRQGAVAEHLDDGRPRTSAARSPRPCRTSSTAPATPCRARSANCPAGPRRHRGGQLRRRRRCWTPTPCAHCSPSTRRRGNARHRAHRGRRRPDRLRPDRARRRRPVTGDRRAEATRRPSSSAITEINSGVYAFDAAVLADALARLSTDNAQGELYLTDVLGIARGGGPAVGALACHDTVAGRGRQRPGPAGRSRRRAEPQAGPAVDARRRDHGRPGHDLAGRGRRAGPGRACSSRACSCTGRTTVGEGATVGPDTTLTDVTIGAGATVVRTHGSGARIGPGASVGPFAYLRPGTRARREGQDRHVRRGQELRHRHRHARCRT